MANPRDDLYTAGELAKLFNISKQTLLYYDKAGLIEPEFISENNYRHYTLKQYVLLEIIINLRKLDIPISTIKSYLNNRSIENFDELMQNKLAECDHIIKKQMAIKDNLEILTQKLEKIKNIQLDELSLQFKQKRTLYITRINQDESPKGRVDSYAKHNIAAYENNIFKNTTTGWIIPAEDFLQKQYNHITCYYSYQNNDCDISKENMLIRPSGLYIVLKAKGTYYQNYEKIATKCIEYMQKKHLEIIGPVYISPVMDHWMTDKLDEYITQISIPVQYTNKTIA